MIALPENWSDWTVIGELGHGSFSVVYEAERKDDPSVRCAIKVITIPQDESEYDDLIADGFDTVLSASFFEEAVRDFTREIKLMEHFKGMQNIVSIEDYKVVPKEDGIGSHIFIRMELLTSLEKYISDKTLSEEEIIQIGLDICTALEFCQEKKIVHRDIKPANIFVNDRLGTHVFYKLGDFGIARNLEGKTQNLSSRGTPNYMAPEVAANQKYNETADIYSLGLTLYWLLNANRLPFFPQTQLYSPAAKREALQRRLSGETLEPPIHASPSLSDIILKACSFQPQDRYQTAGEMKSALEQLQKKNQQAPVSEETIKPAVPEKSTAKKKKTYLLILLPVLILCLGFAIYRGLIHFGEKQAAETPAVFTPETAAPEITVPESTVRESEENTPVPPEKQPESEKTSSDLPAESSEDAAVSSPSPTEQPEPTATAVVQTRMTEIFGQIRSKDEQTRQWLEQIRPDHVLLLREWQEIPLLPDLSSAPSVTAEQKDSRLALTFEDPPGYDRQVRLTLGSEEGSVADEDGTYWLDLSEDGSLSAALLLVTYQSDQDTLEYQYELDGTKGLTCIHAGLTRAIDGGFIRTSESLYEPEICEIRTGDAWITAYYDNEEDGKGQLQQYEDHPANCLYDRKGYLIAGEPEPGTLSPVVFASEGFIPEDGPDDVLLKKMQSMLSQTKKIIEYNGNGAVFLPSAWSGLGIGRPSVNDAPAVAIEKNGEAYELRIEGGGTKWKFNTDHSVLFNEGDQPPDTFELRIDSSEREETDGFWCTITYRVQPDLTAVCTSIAYDYYAFYNADKSNLPVQFNLSRFLYRPCAFSIQLDPDTGVEICEYFYNNFVDHANEAGSYNSFSFTASYQSWLGGTEMQLTSCKATIGSLSDDRSEEFSLALPAVSRQAIPCIQKVQGQAVVIEQTMNSPARLVWPLSTLLSAAAEKEAPKIETVGELSEVHQYRGDTGTWYVQEIRNAGNQPAVVAEISHPLFESGLLRCIPSVIMPGTSAWVISDSPDLYDRLFLTSDDHLSAEVLTTAPFIRSNERINYEVRDDVQLFTICNDTEHDVYDLEYLYFIRNQDGKPVGVCTDEKEYQSPYVLKTGRTISFMAYKEGVDTLQVWGYPNE